MGARYKGGGKARKSPLNLGKRSDYIPAKLNQMDEAMLRKEYSRLRDIAQKRIKRMEKDWDWTKTYKYNVYNYNKLSAIKDKRSLVHKLSDIARFLTADTGAVSGLVKQRNKAILTLHKHGYKFVNAKNWRDFSEFMTWAEDLAIGRMYDSSRIVDVWSASYKKLGDPEKVKELFMEFEAKKRIDDKVISAEKNISSTIMRASKAVKAVKRKGKK